MKTTNDIAREQQCDSSSVRRHAQALGIAKTGRDYVLTAEQESLVLAKLQKKPGNPNMLGNKKLAMAGVAARKKKKKKNT